VPVASSGIRTRELRRPRRPESSTR
jgi:hypothetical protein